MDDFTRIEHEEAGESDSLSGENIVTLSRVGQDVDLVNGDTAAAGKEKDDGSQEGEQEDTTW